MNALLAEHHKRLLEAQIAAVALSTSYQLHLPLTTTPKEVPPPAWVEAAAAYEQRHGVKLTKFFTQGEE